MEISSLLFFTRTGKRRLGNKNVQPTNALHVLQNKNINAVVKSEIPFALWRLKADLIITLILQMTFFVSLNYATFGLVYVHPIVHYYY
jgi:hypothetical protein